MGKESGASMPEEGVESITERLSEITDLYLPHTMAVRRDSLSKEEKKTHLAGLLRRDAAVFLERYGPALGEAELGQFQPLSGDYEVAWHLRRLQVAADPSPRERKARAAVVKNRRLAFMSRLVLEGQYFGEEAMRLRAPLLHHDCLGQFQDPQGPGIVPGGGAAAGPRRGERLSESLMRESREADFRARLAAEQRAAGVLVGGSGAGGVGRGEDLEIVEEEEEEDEFEEEMESSDEEAEGDEDDEGDHGIGGAALTRGAGQLVQSQPSTSGAQAQEAAEAGEGKGGGFAEGGPGNSGSAAAAAASRAAAGGAGAARAEGAAAAAAGSGQMPGKPGGGGRGTAAAGGAGKGSTGEKSTGEGSSFSSRARMAGGERALFGAELDMGDRCQQPGNRGGEGSKEVAGASAPAVAAGGAAAGGSGRAASEGKRGQARPGEGARDTCQAGSGQKQGQGQGQGQGQQRRQLHGGGKGESSAITQERGADLTSTGARGSGGNGRNESRESMADKYNTDNVNSKNLDDDEMEETDGGGGGGRRPSDVEMGDRLAEFTRAMQERFLAGEDAEHVDYGAIDEDATLDDDWLQEKGREAEEKYFEEDE